MATADFTAAPCQITKRCGTCKLHKTLDLFHKNKTARLGVTSKCKECAVQAARAWHHANRSRANATSAAFRAAADPGYAKSYMAAYYERNKDRIKAAVRAREESMKVELRPVNAARAMRRIANRRRATPSWADHGRIVALYQESARLTQETGVPHHVDHIVPLQSRIVCGLHVEANLRVLPKAANQSKSNRWWPDMP